MSLRPRVRAPPRAFLLIFLLRRDDFLDLIHLFLISLRTYANNLSVAVLSIFVDTEELMDK